MKKICSVFAWFFCFISAAHAQSIEIKGFGTAGLIKSSHKTYYLSEYETSGSKLTFTPDSRFGVNLSATLSENWKVAAQFIARANSSTYATYLDWGFVSYQWMPEISLRAGKILNPLWLYSQQINVGYSYLWVRPPVEVYSLLNALKSMNGVSILSSTRLGGGILSSELFGGAGDFETQGNNPAQLLSSYLSLRDTFGLDMTYSKDDQWTLHASYAQGRTDVRVHSTYPVGSNSLYYNTITQLKLGMAKFFSFGGKLDINNFIFTGEFARRLIEGESLRSANAWYGTAGYRLGRFTPHYTYSWQGDLSGSYNIHPDYPTVTSLKRAQFSHLLGLNAQVHHSVVIKAEAQKTKYEFQDYAKDFNVNIFSLSADFIF